MTIRLTRGGGPFGIFAQRAIYGYSYFSLLFYSLSLELLLYGHPA